MQYAPHAFDAQQIDVELFHAVENNAVDYVASLLCNGANPHALIPVSMSQFRSSFRTSKLTHLTATFRALQLYQDDVILSGLVGGSAGYPRVPAAYAFASDLEHDFHGDMVEVDGRSLVVTDLLVAMSVSEKINHENRVLTSEAIRSRLSQSGAASLYAAGDVACDYVAKFLAYGNATELERALALFDIGGQVRGGAAGWQAMARMRGAVRQRDKKGSLEVSLPIAAMFATSQSYSEISARLMKILLVNQAVDCDLREHGLSLLHWAAFLGDAPAIHQLLDHGADAHALSDAGSEAAAEPATPDEIAHRAGNEASANVLRAFNARSRMQSVIDLVRQRMAAMPQPSPLRENATIF